MTGFPLSAILVLSEIKKDGGPPHDHAQRQTPAGRAGLFCPVLLRLFPALPVGVPYNGGTIHIYAIPMMLLMALYVCWVNGGQPLHRRDFLRRRGDLGLFLLPYLALLMVAASFLEAAILGRFSVDLVCMAVLTFLIGLCEEGLFRSCLLKDRGPGTARAVGLLLYSSVTFAVLHMVNVAGGLPVEAAVTQSLGSFPFGLVAGFLYLRTGHLTGLAFWHMSVDYKIFASMAAPLKSVLVVGELVDLVMIAALVWGVVRTVQDGKKQRKAGA